MNSYLRERLMNSNIEPEPEQSEFTGTVPDIDF